MITCGIDNGTQSTKVLIYDSTDKKVLSLTSSKHDLICKEDGSREQQASWWINALKDCFDQVPNELKLSIQAIGVSGQQHGFVPVDASGEVLAPVKLWCDTSTVAECNEINMSVRSVAGVAPGSACVAEMASGTEIKTGYTAPKVLWFKKHEPTLYNKMRWIMLPHDYLNFVLTGKPSMEYGDASGTGFFDVKALTWSNEVLKAIDPDRDLKQCLPPLHQSEAIIGNTCASASAMFGIPEGIPVSTGGGDNMMGAIGTGTVSDGDLTMSMGTSGTLYGVSSTPVIDKKGRLSTFCSSSGERGGQWLPLLCTMNCTVSSEVTRNLFGKDLEAFNRAAERSPLGAEGIFMLPYFNGERTPNYPNGNGCIFGLTPNNTTAQNLCRAAMEASVYAMKYGLEAFLELGFKPQSIKLIGGGAKSSLWRQMVSDVTGLPVVCPANPEAAAFGAALQALFALQKASGEVKSIDQITRTHVKLQRGKSAEPNLAAHERYLTAYETWLKYVNCVAPLFA